MGGGSRHTDGSVLFYRYADTRFCIWSSMDRMPLRYAARRFKDLSIKQRAEKLQSEKRVSSIVTDQLVDV